MEPVSLKTGYLAMLYDAMLDPQTDAEYLHRKVAAFCRPFNAAWEYFVKCKYTR
jgi:hypothetical protein